MDTKIELVIPMGTIVKVKGLAKRLRPDLIVRVDESFLDEHDLMDIDDELQKTE